MRLSYSEKDGTAARLIPLNVFGTLMEALGDLLSYNRPAKLLWAQKLYLPGVTLILVSCRPLTHLRKTQ